MTKTSILVTLICLLVVVQTFSFKKLNLKDSCINFDNENACQGQQTDNDDSWANRNFQTPPRGDPLWRESFQDYNILVGYPMSTYSSSGVNITVYTRLNPAFSSLQLKYSNCYSGITTMIVLLIRTPISYRRDKATF